MALRILEVDAANGSLLSSTEIPLTDVPDEQGSIHWPDFSDAVPESAWAGSGDPIVFADLGIVIPRSSLFELVAWDLSQGDVAWRNLGWDGAEASPLTFTSWLPLVGVGLNLVAYWQKGVQEVLDGLSLDAEVHSRISDFFDVWTGRSEAVNDADADDIIAIPPVQDPETVDVSFTHGYATIQASDGKEISRWENPAIGSVEEKTALNYTTIRAVKVILSLSAGDPAPSLKDALGMTDEESAHPQGVTKWEHFDPDTGARTSWGYVQGQQAPSSSGEDRRWTWWAFLTTPVEYTTTTAADMPWSPIEAASDGARVFFCPGRLARWATKQGAALDPEAGVILWTKTFPAAGNVRRSNYAHQNGSLWIWVDGTMYKLEASSGTIQETWEHTDDVHGNTTTDDLIVTAGQLVYHSREIPETSTPVETTLRRWE